MALVAACIRESICTASRIHQHIRKNSVSLKEVLTRQCQHAQHALNDNTTTRVRSNANSALKPCLDECRDCRKCLYCRCFLNSLTTRVPPRAPHGDSPEAALSTWCGL